MWLETVQYLRWAGIICPSGRHVNSDVTKTGIYGKYSWKIIKITGFLIKKKRIKTAVSPDQVKWLFVSKKGTPWLPFLKINQKNLIFQGSISENVLKHTLYLIS